MIWLLFWQHSQAIIFIKNGHPDWVSGSCERDARDTNMRNELRAQSRATGPEKLTSAYFWSPQTPTHFISGFKKWMTLQTYFSTDLIPSKVGSYHATFFPISPRVSVIDCLLPTSWLIWFKLWGARHGLVLSVRPSQPLPFVSQSSLTRSDN